MTEQEALQAIRTASETRAKELQLSDIEFTPAIEDALAGLVELEILELRGQKITRLPARPPQNLGVLICSQTQVQDLAHLSNLTQLQTLWCWDTQVQDLAPLSKLTQLQELNCSGTQVKDLAPLSNLTQLQTLYCSQTQVQDLAPLSNLTQLQTLLCYDTQVEDLAPLSNLTLLQTLHCSGTQVQDLAPLSNLTLLQTLQCSSTQVKDLAPLSKLTQLQTLRCSSTQVKDLAPLSNLTLLQTLWCSYTQVKDLAPLSKLTQLQTLDCSRTQVKDLAPVKAMIERGIEVKWEGIGWQSGIYIQDCPLTNPPPEIVKQGNAAILEWLESTEKGSRRVNETKVLVLGEGEAGKTSLINRIRQPEKPLPKSTATRGIDIHSLPVPDTQPPLRLHFWDFGGQDIYLATHQFFLTEEAIYVLLDDSRKTTATEGDDRFYYWLETIRAFGKGSPAYLFQNLRDNQRKPLDREGIMEHYHILKIYRENLDHVHSADEFYRDIIAKAIELPHNQMDIRPEWFEVKKQLEKEAETQPVLSLADYQKLYAKTIGEDDQKALVLSRHLTTLGSLLHFQHRDVLKDKLILRPHWLTEAIYKLIDDTQIAEGQRGFFTEEDCERLWGESQYTGCHALLRALMEEFELIYAVKSEGYAPKWLMPILLPIERPDIDFGEGEEMRMEYVYDFLPKGLVARLITRLHRFLPDTQDAWVNGALFQNSQAKVLVEAFPNNRKILVRAQGEIKSTLFGIITDDLNHLNEAYFKPEKLPVHQRKATMPKRMIACPCEECKGSHSPYLFEYDDILKSFKKGTLKKQCNRSDLDVPIEKLLFGFSVREDVLKEIQQSLGEMRNHQIDHSKNIDQKIEAGFERLSESDRKILGTLSHIKEEIESQFGQIWPHLKHLEELSLETKVQLVQMETRLGVEAEGRDEYYREFLMHISEGVGLLLEQLPPSEAEQWNQVLAASPEDTVKSIVSKMKVTIPLIPGILKYEGTATDVGKDAVRVVKTAWQGLLKYLAV